MHTNLIDGPEKSRMVSFPDTFSRILTLFGAHTLLLYGIGTYAQDGSTLTQPPQQSTELPHQQFIITSIGHHMILTLLSIDFHQLRLLQ